MSEFDELVQIMKRLRDPGGCPWDREQNHESLKPYLVEEVYEVLDAIDRMDDGALKEELGDLMLQIVFHAQIASEAGAFGLADVAGTIADKLVRRHPHVFGETKVDGVAGVMVNWDRIKGREYGEERTSILSGVPSALPALMRAQKLQDKAAKVGFEWEDISGALAKFEEERHEFQAALANHGRNADQESHAHLCEEFGDVLFTLVNIARYLDIDSEDALRRTADKFQRRFRYIEETAAGRGRQLAEMTLVEMDALWEETKRME